MHGANTFEYEMPSYVLLVLVRDRLIDNYSVEKHKEEVRIELKERGYSNDMIEEWVSYIE